MALVYTPVNLSFKPLCRNDHFDHSALDGQQERSTPIETNGIG